MRLLILSLPPGPPGSYAYATSTDGQTLAGHGNASATLLPPAGRGVEVVAVVPASQLSWQQVNLPPGVGRSSPRLRAVLTGLLEDQLLDDAEQLHFAVSPTTNPDGSTWVAVCPKTWLSEHLHALDAAQRPVSRIVPELHPRSGPVQLTVVGESDRPNVLMSGDGVPGGAQVLPLSPHTLAFIRDIDSAAGAANPSSTDVVAEPAVAQGAEQLLGGGVTIQSAAQRLLLSSRSDWDLAQLDLARTGTARMTKRAAAVWRDFLHAPLWRPARWGVGLLLLANVVGLNLWAWQTQRDLTARRAQINSLLTATFPQVKVVVDAPVQMQRELAALRQATGAASPRDLEPMLTAVARGLPPKTVPAGVDFSVGELRLKGVPLTAEPLDIGNQRLRPQGYQLRSDGDSVVLREGGAP